LKPSALLALRLAIKNGKYHLLFSRKRRGKPGPKGPGKDLIEAVVQMKQRNFTWGCPRIAQQIALAFGIDINNDKIDRRNPQRSGFPARIDSLSFRVVLGLQSIAVFQDYGASNLGLGTRKMPLIANSLRTPETDPSGKSSWRKSSAGCGIMRPV
jgi:hypothetical protein